MTFQFSNGWFSKIFKVVFVVVVKVVFIVTLFYPLESSSELSWILILPEYGFILAHMTNHSIALHGLRILLSCIYLSPIMIATYLEVMIWTSIYTIWVCFHIIDINPKTLSFFWWVLPHLHYYSLRLILLSHGEHKLIMGLDRSCKYGTGSWKKKKDGDLRLSKRLGFELQYHPLNIGAFFICTCILLHEILIPHLMTSLGTKHSFLILGRQSSLSGVFKRL